MVVIKSGMLLPLALRRPSPPHQITSSSSSPATVATNLRVNGRRHANGKVEVSTSIGPSVRRNFSSFYSYVNDDHDFVDSLSSWNCIGSSHGWLGYINPNNLSFYLFKPSLINDPSYLPFISLPPLQFFSDYPNAISKMVFSSSPSPIHRHAIHDNNNNNNSSVLVVITLDYWVGQLGPAATFCKIGDPGWTTLANFPVESPCSNNIFQDIAYYSRHNLFYIVTNSGEIYSWNLSNYHYCPMKQQQDCEFKYLIKPPKTTKSFPRKFRCVVKEIVNCKYYLVMDESSGALMMIRLQIHYIDGVSNKLYNHDVHRLDFDRKRLKWFPVTALVNTALFIGRNNGSVVDVRKVPGLMIPGYIYLACTVDNVFQLTALCVNGGACVAQEFGLRNFDILRAEMTEDDDMTSFPVWNFG